MSLVLRSCRQNRFVGDRRCRDEVGKPVIAAFMGNWRFSRVDRAGSSHYVPRQSMGALGVSFVFEVPEMKIRNSLKALMGRHRANKLVRRRGRTYIINKVNKRFKARQG